MIEPGVMNTGDWSLDNMSMDDTAFAKYAEQLEKEDFEADVLRVCCSIRQLVEARLDTRLLSIVRLCK